jgi:hypothetical protein
MQYERLPMYHRIRDSIDAPKTPFEHILLVASNKPRRCIDLVWIVLGFDPFGFRVSTDWWADDFAFGMVSGVLRGTSASGVKPLSVELEPLCVSTNRRAFPGVNTDANEMELIASEVSEKRMTAYSEAVFLVELNADDMIRESLIEAAMHSPSEKRDLAAQIKMRLVRMFGRKKDDPAFVKAVDDAYLCHSTCKVGRHISQRIESEDGANVDWPSWLCLYRCCLDELKKTFGLPGDIFSDATLSGTDRVEDRRLGELPQRKNAANSNNPK